MVNKLISDTSINEPLLNKINYSSEVKLDYDKDSVENEYNDSNDSYENENEDNENDSNENEDNENDSIENEDNNSDNNKVEDISNSKNLDLKLLI